MRFRGGDSKILGAFFTVEFEDKDVEFIFNMEIYWSL